MKKILVTGAGGFIGTHLVTELKRLGHFVVGVDIEHNKFVKSNADFFIIQDLCNQSATNHLFRNFQFDEVYNLAAVMGGMEYLCNGKHDYDVLNQSSLINLNIIDNCIRNNVKRVFFSSSACVYNETKQMHEDVVALKEPDAYPMQCDLEYGYQKLITERIYMAGERCHGIQIRIGRFHNIFGEYTLWEGEKAKAPAAICRKVAQGFHQYGEIDIWGDGKQTRSFTYITDCIQGIIRLMNSDCNEPINIGSDELISINDLAKMVIAISGKNLVINNIDGPQGVRGRNSDNTLIYNKLGWKPTQPLQVGIEKLYKWVNEQVNGRT